MRVERLDEDSPDAGCLEVNQCTRVPDTRDDLADDPGQPGVTAGAQRYETRDRATYYEDLRAAVAADRQQSASRRASADSGDGGAQHEVCWPDSGRPEVSDGQKLRQGNDGRVLDGAVDAEVRRCCERIQETERTVITPAIREIEAAEPGRELVGLDHRVKGEERLKEKVTNMLRAQPGMTTDQALTAVPDAIRFTFCYSEQRYAAGVSADLERLSARGFELTKLLRNYWGSDKYKGINTQCEVPRPFRTADPLGSPVGGTGKWHRDIRNTHRNSVKRSPGW